jgi:glycosyltransferase involved in cell wall biosynthesis
MSSLLEFDFTVLMCVYGKDDPVLFQRAVSSVFDNSVKPDHMVLVVDGPVPLCLAEVVEGLQAQYGFQVVRLDKNVGLARALNEGLKHVNTRWVARADADDINREYRFERQAAALRQLEVTDVAVLGGGICERSHFQGKVVGIRDVPLSHDEIRAFSRRRSPFNHMTVVFRRDVVEAAGGYPNIPFREDYALWVKLLSIGVRCANLPDILVDATTGQGFLKRRGGWRYAWVEVELQRYFYRLGVKSFTSCAVDGMVRGFGFLLPVRLKSILYKTMLRSVS